MKRSISIILIIGTIGILFVSGCGSDKQNKALIGGAIGAGVGQAVGRDTEATLIGAGVGAGAGYLLGKDEPKPAAQPQPGYSHSSVNSTEHIPGVKRFGDIIADAQSEYFYGPLLGTMRGHQDDRNVFICFA